jgi:hypothetical protein
MMMVAVATCRRSRSGPNVEDLACLIRDGGGWQANSPTGAPSALFVRPSVSPLALITGVGAGGFPERVTGAKAAPSLMALSASARPRHGGSKWRLGRLRQRRAGRVTPSR